MSDDAARRSGRNLWFEGFFSRAATTRREPLRLPEVCMPSPHAGVAPEPKPTRETASVASRRALHVLLVDHRWSVFYTNASIPVSTHERKRDALQVAHGIAAREDVDLMIFAADPAYVPALDDTL